MRAQPGFRLIGLARRLQFRLRRKNIMVDAQQRQITPDHVHHLRHGEGAECHQPVGFGRTSETVAIFGSQRLAHRDQIIAGIKPFGDRADILAQRLAVTQMRRPGEHVHLTAGIIDIIFADHLVPGIFEQGRKRVADHRAPAMAHMHGAGGVGRHIFDIDADALPQIGPTIVGAIGMDRGQFRTPGRVRQRHVDKAWAGDRDFADLVKIFQRLADQLSKLTGFHTGAFG